MADDYDYFLDRYPVTPDELQVLLSLEQEYSKNGSISFPNSTSIDEDLLATIFSTAYANVFCVNETPRDRFLEAAVSLLGRRGDRFLWDALFEYATMQTREVVDDGDDLADSKVLLGLLFSLATRALQKEETAIPDGFCQCLSQSKISRPEWIQWAMTTLPGNSLHRALSTVFCSAMFGPDWPNATVFSVPTFFATHEAIALAGMGLNHGAWRKLYNSDENGLSFHTFREALLGYYGTTIILIRTTEKDCLGYYTQVPWKTSPKWFTGEGTSFLFRLSPSWNVYPVADENVRNGLSTTTKIRYHQYLHLPPVQQTKQNSLRGLAIGGVAADAPRLLINEKLEQCQASFNDLSFVQGPLLSDPDNYFFDVDLLEVWTVESSEDDLKNGVEAGKLQAAVREGARQRLAHVDRKEFLQDFTSGAVMTTLFDHRQQARGRADFVASEDESKGYFVESKPPSPRISGRKVRSGSVNELDWE